MQTAIKDITATIFRRSGDDGLSEPPLGALTYAASAVVNLLALALPLTVLQVYDRVLPNAAYATLTVLLLALAGAIAADALLKYLRSKVVNWSAASFSHKTHVRALSAMLASRPSAFGRATASEHLERLNSIAGLGNHFSAQSRTVIVDICFIPVFSAVIILVGGWVFAGVVMLFMLFGYLALKRAQSLNDLIEERETLDARKQDFIIEVLSAVHTVKANAMEPLMMRRFERLQSSASMLTKKMITLTGAAQNYQVAYASVSTVMIVSVGAFLALQGRLTLGALACCMLLSSQLLQPLMKSLTSWNEIKLAQHRRTRVNAIFEDCANGPAPPPQRKGTRPPARFSPKSITLQSVTIRHDDGPALFENVNLHIKAGAFVAIRGADGSGRSTLLRALLDDAPLVDGKILIGDDEAPGAKARATVRYVGQTPVIFRGSILDNITLYGETPTNVALSAAKLTGLDAEVVRMPLGYDTILKSNLASDVPVPTAQRITLTRAIAMRPSVLVLDEANALLDLTGEQLFIQALEKLRGRVTLVVSSHRPSLMRLADQVYEIRNRKLVEAAPPGAPQEQAAS